MPLALLERMPPTVAVLMEAGSGPNLVEYGRRARFTWAPMTPGWTLTRAPLSSTWMPRQCRATSTRMPSLIAWPDRLVPAARKVMGIPAWRLRRNRPWTSATLPANTTARGISR